MSTPKTGPPCSPSYYLAVCGLNHSVRRCKLRPPCWVYFELVSSQKLCVKLRNELLLIDAPSKSSHFRVDFYGKIWESYENVCHRIPPRHMWDTTGEYLATTTRYPFCSHYHMSNCYYYGFSYLIKEVQSASCVRRRKIVT